METTEGTATDSTRNHTTADEDSAGTDSRGKADATAAAESSIATSETGAVAAAMSETAASKLGTNNSSTSPPAKPLATIETHDDTVAASPSAAETAKTKTPSTASVDPIVVPPNGHADAGTTPAHNLVTSLPTAPPAAKVPPPTQPPIVASTQLVGPIGIKLFGVYFLGLAIVLIQALVNLWPTTTTIGSTSAPNTATTAVANAVPLFFGLLPVNLTPDERLILIVAAAAALGSYVSVTNSFVAYVGNRQFTWNWSWWYLLLPFSSAMTALIFYFALRGGLFTSSVSADSGSIYVIATLSGLVGMYSREASDALHRLFSTIVGAKTPTTELAEPLQASGTDKKPTLPST